MDSFQLSRTMDSHYVKEMNYLPTNNSRHILNKIFKFHTQPLAWIEVYLLFPSAKNNLSNILNRRILNPCTASAPSPHSIRVAVSLYALSFICSVILPGRAHFPTLPPAYMEGLRQNRAGTTKRRSWYEGGLRHSVQM